METEQGLSENSPLILNRCALNAQQRKRFREGESIDQIIEHEEPVEKIADEAEPRLVTIFLHPSDSTHSISLKKSEDYLPTERYSHPLFFPLLIRPVLIRNIFIPFSVLRMYSNENLYTYTITY